VAIELLAMSAVHHVAGKMEIPLFITSVFESGVGFGPLYLF
jgi:hypothetical protein